MMEMAERLSEEDLDELLPGSYSKEMWIKNVFEVWEKKNEKSKAKLDEVWSICIVFCLCTCHIVLVFVQP